jgi:hypothetical protein
MFLSICLSLFRSILASVCIFWKRTKRRTRQNLPVHSLTSHSHTELTAQKKKKNSFFSHSHRPSSSSGTYPLPVFEYWNKLDTMSFMSKFKQASRTLVDTGAKTMLRVSSRKTLQLEKITYYTQATTDIDSVYSDESKFKLVSRTRIWMVGQEGVLRFWLIDCSNEHGSEIQEHSSTYSYWRISLVASLL